MGMVPGCKEDGDYYGCLWSPEQLELISKLRQELEIVEASVTKSKLNPAIHPSLCSDMEKYYMKLKEEYEHEQNKKIGRAHV